MTTGIQQNSVVSINYILRDESKNIVDSSEGREPLVYLHGYGQIIPGLEQALVGKNIGEKLNVEVLPSEGYGEYRTELTLQVSKSQFPPEAQLEVGSMFEFSNPNGAPVVVRVTALDGENVTVDANHPLAGKTLSFEVEVLSIREATPEEIEHGHAHGEDEAEETMEEVQ